MNDYKNAKGEWAKGNTYSYRRWRGLHVRLCSSFTANRQTYEGCTLSPLFKNYQTFADWHVAQIGYDQGYEIDKDLLFPGNKHYSEDTCILVPKIVNMFIRDKYKKGIKPTKYGTYRAEFVFMGKPYKLRNCATEVDALAARAAAKAHAAGELHSMLCATVIDPRVLEKLKQWSVNGNT